MNIKNMSKEELENTPYDDLAFALLTEKKHAMKIIDLFKEIGKLIELTDAEVEDKIGDFFELLTLDKRFVMLDDGSWDLRTRHVGEVIIDDDEEDVTLDLEDVEETLEIEEKEDEIFYDEEDDDEPDDDLKDLVIIDDEDSEL